MLATINIQPHVKNKITPQKLMPFPWDKRRHEQHDTGPKLTAEERHKRFEELAAKLGDTTI